MTTLSDIELFRIIVETGSLTAAAQSIGSSPPAVSRRLSGLELRLGVQLAERNARRFKLTPEGELLFERGRKILDQLHVLETEISSHGDLEHGLLRVVAPSEFGRRHVARLVGEFVDLHPGLRAHLDTSDAGLEVTDEVADVVLRIGRPENGTAIARKVASSRCVICASPSYIARKGRPSSLAELASHDCLVLARRFGLADVWHFAGHDGVQDVLIPPRYSSGSGDVLHSWLLEGRGISYEALWDVGDDLVAGKLVDLFPNERP